MVKSKQDATFDEKLPRNNLEIFHFRALKYNHDGMIEVNRQSRLFYHIWNI